MFFVDCKTLITGVSLFLNQNTVVRRLLASLAENDAPAEQPKNTCICTCFLKSQTAGYQKVWSVYSAQMQLRCSIMTYWSILKMPIRCWLVCCMLALSAAWQRVDFTPSLWYLKGPIVSFLNMQSARPLTKREESHVEQSEPYTGCHGFADWMCAASDLPHKQSLNNIWVLYAFLRKLV